MKLGSSDVLFAQYHHADARILFSNKPQSLYIIFFLFIVHNDFDFSTVFYSNLDNVLLHVYSTRAVPSCPPVLVFSSPYDSALFFLDCYHQKKHCCLIQFFCSELCPGDMEYDVQTCQLCVLLYSYFLVYFTDQLMRLVYYQSLRDSLL